MNPRPAPRSLLLRGLVLLLAATTAACAPRPSSAQQAAPPAADSPAADAPLEVQWDALLARHVRPCAIDGVPLAAVDYAALGGDPAFERLVATLAAAPEPAGGEEALAFWINAYNILAIRVVVAAHPVASIRDIGSVLRSVWKREAGVAAGAPRTLDEIEHEILRTMGDPRIHAAIVCASVSCPDLRAEAYRADRLDEQLDDAMRRWLAEPAKGARLDADGATLHLSAIFDWFGGDFLEDGRPLVEVLRTWMPEEMAARVGERTPRVRFMEYDWSLNDAARCPPAPARGE